MKCILSILIFVLLSNTIIWSQNNKLQWYDGKIGDYAISMYISKDTTTDEFEKPLISYSGYYYYHSQLLPISVNNYDQNTNKSFKLSAYNKDESEETFVGTKNSEGISGDWTHGNKTLPFSLKVNNKHHAYYLTKDYFHKPIDTVAIEEKLSFNLMVPVDKSVEKLLISSYTEGRYSDVNIWMNAMNEEYRAEFSSMLQEEDYKEIVADDRMYMYNWEHQYSINPIIISDERQVWSISHYTYTGGAHGMYNEWYYNYDNKLKKILSAKDVFDLSKEKRIADVIKRFIKKEYNIPNNKSLTEADDSIFISDDVGFSENFIIGKKAIRFYYGLYELTPYAYGIFEIDVPIEHLLPYFNKNFNWK